jgi:hypothetical protein
MIEVCKHTDGIMIYDDIHCPMCLLLEEQNKKDELIEQQAEMLTNLHEDNTRLCSGIEDLEQANSLLQEAIDKFGSNDLNDGR